MNIVLYILNISHIIHYLIATTVKRLRYKNLRENQQEYMNYVLQI